VHILSNISSLRTYTLSVLLLSTLFLTACDSGGSSLTEKQIALNKISAYAEDGSKSVPSLQDYIDAGVGGLNGGSLADFNALVEKLGKEDVDTTAEIEALVETPIAMPVSAITDEDTPKDITLVGLEFDGDALTYSKVTGPAHGSLSIAGNIATYTPTANYNGSDSFTYKANDGTGDSNTATVSITVNAVNDAPTANTGFNFTKLNANGVTLADQSVAYADTPWNCVKDNVTGLIWEIKTISGLHNTNDSYTWYNPDALTNGGSAGYQRRSDQTGVESDNPTCFNYANGTESTYCNTKAYVARVNAEAYCGATDWRMPSREELRSIVDYSRKNPAIDVDYFPNTLSWVWSSSPSPYNSDFAWNVNFSNGYVNTYNKSNVRQVRLVRSGQ